MHEYRARITLLIYEHGTVNDPRVERRWLDTITAPSLERAWAIAAKGVRAATPLLAREARAPVAVHIARLELVRPAAVPE